MALAGKNVTHVDSRTKFHISVTGYGLFYGFFFGFDVEGMDEVHKNTLRETV